MRSLDLVFICLALASCINLSFAQNSTGGSFVDAHNQARNQVGAGLPGFTWDQTLVKYAQAYANRVRNANSCNNLVHSRGRYGENLAYGFRDMTGRRAVSMWVGEKADYNYQANTCAAGKACGHYTQVVWRKSVRLGCAKVQCADGWVYVICNYDPPGNIKGQRPY